MLTLAGACFALTARARGPRAPANLSTLEAWLLTSAPQVFPDRAAIHAVGRDYLAAHPAEAPALADACARPAAGAAPDALRERVALDWRDRDVVVIDGWLLSRTEARLCARACLATPA